MEPECQNREHEGELNCPLCEKIVGQYSWNGLANEDGKWISPAFVLHKVEVAEHGDAE